MEKQKNAVGRRKEAVTRVFISKGEGKITVNDKDYKNYFPLVYLQNQVEAPLKTADAIGKFDRGTATRLWTGVARAREIWKTRGMYCCT